MNRYSPSAYRGVTKLQFLVIQKEKREFHLVPDRQDLDEPITNEKKQTKKIGRPRAYYPISKGWLYCLCAFNHRLSFQLSSHRPCSCRLKPTSSLLEFCHYLLFFLHSQPRCLPLALVFPYILLALLYFILFFDSLAEVYGEPTTLLQLRFFYSLF